MKTCPTHDCGKPVAKVVTVMTRRMKAPGFYEACEDCARKWSEHYGRDICGIRSVG